MMLSSQSQSSYYTTVTSWLSQILADLLVLFITSYFTLRAWTWRGVFLHLCFKGHLKTSEGFGMFSLYTPQ